MDKIEFKKRWESDKNGGGITWDDIAECAVDWNVTPRPRTKNMAEVRYKVLKAADVIDAEEFKPEEE